MAIRRVTRAGVGLVVGIIILALLIWWGLVFVQQRGEQARHDEAVKIADEQLKSETENGVAVTPDNSSSNSSSSNSQSNSSTSTSNGSTSTSDSSNSSELPKTGPSDFFASVAILSILAFTVVSFAHSRKLLAERV